MTSFPGRNAQPPPADERSASQQDRSPGQALQPGQRSGRGSQSVLKHLRKDSQGRMAPQQAPRRAEE